MKRLLFILPFLFFAFISNGQDRIAFKNAEELDAKVLNVTPKTITYKRWDNLDGPTYTKYKSDISFIVYQNGTK